MSSGVPDDVIKAVLDILWHQFTALRNVGPGWTRHNFVTHVYLDVIGPDRTFFPPFGSLAKLPGDRWLVINSLLAKRDKTPDHVLACIYTEMTITDEIIMDMPHAIPKMIDCLARDLVGKVYAEAFRALKR